MEKDFKYLLGVTGNVATGKGYACRAIQRVVPTFNLRAKHIECDEIGKIIIGNDYRYIEPREQIAQIMGNDLLLKDSSIDLNLLRKRFQENSDFLNVYNDIAGPYFSKHINYEIAYAKEEIVLLETALLAELNAFELCDYNVLLLRVDDSKKTERFDERENDNAELFERDKKQFSYAKKKRTIEDAIAKANRGCLIELDTTNSPLDIEYFEVMKCFLTKLGY